MDKNEERKEELRKKYLQLQLVEFHSKATIPSSQRVFPELKETAA